MFDRFLVPTDFSAPSEAALGYARTLAGTFGGALHVLHVLDSEFLRVALGDPHDQETAALRQLHDRLTDDDRRRFRAFAIVERSDEPADAIASYARTHDIDVIVMGTHGRTGMKHLLAGSVAEKVVRTAPCPVLTLRDTASGQGGARPARILVPTDYSAPSDAALACARRLAAQFGSSLHILHVLEEVAASSAFGSEFYMGDSPDVRAARLKDAQERLAHRVIPGGQSQVHTTAEVVSGRSAQAIVDSAANGNFDLIVMGTHGRSGVAHLLMGSVAETVVRTASCPVLTVREIRERAPEPVKDGKPINATA